MLSSYLSRITSSDIQNFLIEHEHDDEKLLVLKQKEIHGIPAYLLATQLSGRRKAKSKLPSWYRTKGIIYPPTVNFEQCSSEATAIFKTHIINSFIPTKHLAADITGGFGVDAYLLSSTFDAIHYAEPNIELFEIARHNHHQFGASTILHHHLSAEEFIDMVTVDLDLIYIDPSRRNEQSRKVYRLADCTPDITHLQEALFKKSRFILLKASPLLDIQQGLREFQHVKRVYVVSVGNECKELLFLAEKNFEGEPFIEAVDLWENGEIKSTISFTISEERNTNVPTGEPDRYIYEPNAAILKSGAFKLLSSKFGVTKLAVNTHLYTSSVLVPDFPGKIFLVECLNPDSKRLRELLPVSQVNIVSRNYPLTPDEIKKKWRLRDGGQKFLIGFSSSKEKHLALCTRVTGI